MLKLRLPQQNKQKPLILDTSIKQIFSALSRLERYEMSEYVLEMYGIQKSFPGVQALNNVDFRLRPGTVHALVGENGAGKSTLMKCLFGLYSIDSGQVYLQGREVSFNHPRQALEHGVAMVHQELNQVPKRNVMENLWLGRLPKKTGFVNEKKMYENTKKAFSELGIDINPRAIMENLSVSVRQMVEIAKAVSYHSKVIVFDEPTSSLTENEAAHLFRIIDRLRKNDCGIIYISHKMEEIFKISDEITIMRDGKVVSSARTADLTVPSIIKQMVGRELSHQFPPKQGKPGDIVMEVKNLSGEYNQVQEVSFHLRKGEILGLAGLVGAGRTEILELLFGVATRKSGEIKIDGHRIENKNARYAIRNGFAFLTEERHATGIFRVLNIRHNTVISNLKKYRKMCMLSNRAMNADTAWAIESMSIKTPSQEVKIQSLSGGNQQKVIIGRWFLTNPCILLLDEPTRGIDVGAKYEIYQLMFDAVSNGQSIIVVSSEMPELLGICDRILVISGGRIAGEFDGQSADQEKILECAASFV